MEHSAKTTAVRHLSILTFISGDKVGLDRISGGGGDFVPLFYVDDSFRLSDANGI